MLRLCAARVVTQLLILALITAAVFLPGLATLPVTDRDEARFVQASRQMVASGDLIDIRFQDGARHKKPVGIYWMQALAMTAQGEGAAAPLWASRMPSFLAAIAAVVLVQVAGTALIGGARATLAALIFAGTLVLAGEARIAKTDAVLLALVLGAMAVMARLYMQRAIPVWQVYAFWACLGLAALVKGPVGPMVVGLAALALAVILRDRRWLAPLGNHWAIVLGLAILLPWVIAISLRSGGEFWHASVGADLLAKVAQGQEGKGAPPGTYLALVWLTFWPGSLLLALMLPAIWAARCDPAMRFLIAWAVPTWIVLELVPTKLIHYPLPVYPALALMVAQVWMGRTGPLSLQQRAVAIPFLALGPALLVGAIWLALTTGAVSATWPAAVALPWVALLAVAAWQMLARDLRHATPACLTLMAAITSAGVIATLARVPWLWPSDNVAALMQTAAVPGCATTGLVAVGYNEPSLIVRTSQVTALLPAGVAVDRLRAGCAVIAVEDRAASEFAVLATGLELQMRGRVDGFAIGAGRRVGLNVFSVGARP